MPVQRLFQPAVPGNSLLEVALGTASIGVNTGGKGKDPQPAHGDGGPLRQMQPKHIDAGIRHGTAPFHLF